MSKPIPTVNSVNITFYVGKGHYQYNVSTKECNRLGFGPMCRYYPLDENSVNDKIAKEFIEKINLDFCK